MKAIIFSLILAVFAAPFAKAGVTKGTYLGTSKTTVQYLDPNTLQPVATEVFTCNETVIVSVPKKAGVQIESNPFNLAIVASAPKNPPVDGDVKAASARIFPTISGGTALVEYWALQNTATGFVGELDDNHLADGLSRDRVIANLSGPNGAAVAYKMQDAQIAPGLQCTLVATVTGRQMVLKITGYAFVPGQAIIQFKTKINARR